MRKNMCMEGEILGHARDCVRVSVYVMFETIERYSKHKH